METARLPANGHGAVLLVDPLTLKLPWLLTHFQFRTFCLDLTMFSPSSLIVAKSFLSALKTWLTSVGKRRSLSSEKSSASLELLQDGCRCFLIAVHFNGDSSGFSSLSAPAAAPDQSSGIQEGLRINSPPLSCISAVINLQSHLVIRNSWRYWTGRFNTSGVLSVYQLLSAHSVGLETRETQSQQLSVTWELRIRPEEFFLLGSSSAGGWSKQDYDQCAPTNLQPLKGNIENIGHMFIWLAN